MFVEQFLSRRSKYHVPRATFVSLEQLSCSSSNFCLDGAIIMFLEQLLSRWSNYHVRRASFASLEQLSCSSSNFRIDGATIMFLEQLSHQMERPPPALPPCRRTSSLILALFTV